MPLTFSECEGTRPPGDLFEVLKDNAVVDTSRGCTLIKNQIPALTKLDLDNFSQEHKVSEEKSFLNELNHIYISEDIEEDSVVETTALREVSEESKLSCNYANDADNYLTVSGTIKRGKKRGQSVEVVLNMSREELEILEANMISRRGCPCTTTNGSGFHVLLWTILCFPLSVIISGVYSFCMGTITWYNIFKFFSDNKALTYRVLFPPLLVILYPFLIILISTGLGLYAGVQQLSCCWDSWRKEFTDYEKGFYGWICNALDISECCPYEVVILSTIQKS